VTDGIEIRHPQPTEYPYLRDSWMEFAAGRTPRGVARWVWRQCYGAWVDLALARYEVRVAAVPDVDTVLGWAVWEMPARGWPLTIHHVYVRRAARRRGIGTRLLHEATRGADTRGWTASHRTKTGDALKEHYVQSGEKV